MVNPDDEQLAETRECVAQLRDFLSAYGVGLHETPAVLQINSFSQRDMGGEVSDIAAALDLSTLATCLSNAASGEGLLEALTTLFRQTLDRINACGQQGDQNDGIEKSASVVDPKNHDVMVTPTSEAETGAGMGDPAAQTGNDRPLVTILSKELYADGTTIKIPLEIQCGTAQRRLVVTVSVAAVD
jgi:hypothetical protein